MPPPARPQLPSRVGVGSFPSPVTPTGIPSKGSPQLGSGDPPREALPLAPDLKGNRPKSDPTVIAPAATRLPPGDESLAAPAPLGLPVKPSQVRIRELRPLGLKEAETIAEVNNPSLKAAASQVEQAQSRLLAQIALWYPQISLNANSLPTYTGGQQFSSGITGTGQQVGNTGSSIWRMSPVLQASWSLIDPSRTPRIAAARDDFEVKKNGYLIALRDLRLQTAKAYFDLQQADELVQVGQESVRASLVSLRDARARFQAGVATKLEVLEAETQLARNQQQATEALAKQAVARRTIAQLLALPQDVTPTAKEPARVLGTWKPTLQESIVAAYAFREELDQILLNISIANNSANESLAQIQPVLRIVNTLSYNRSQGYNFIAIPNPAEYGWAIDNTVGLNLSWNLFDGGRSKALYREKKQLAQENRFRFAERRDIIRLEVEQSYYLLEQANRNITTTARQVLSASEALRLARLRFQAGVTTQREVVDNQRDLTQAQVFYTQAISDYNKSLAELSRRTGLDQVGFCKQPQLPAKKPRIDGVGDVPIEPTPLAPACLAQSREAVGGVDPGAPGSSTIPTAPAGPRR
ncbi:MAG: TolC family protein [Synechococcaceae cyanobacterium]|nr:TolC family protein [Synechococcaceae cyanobacterium]